MRYVLIRETAISIGETQNSHVEARIIGDLDFLIEFGNEGFSLFAYVESDSEEVIEKTIREMLDIHS
jgi:hypothetical protein